MPRHTFDLGPDPYAGLRQRRERQGLPVGQIDQPRPLERWQAIELANVATISRLRAEGRC